MLGMGFAGIDHAFELGVGESAVGHEPRWQMRAIVRFRRRNGSHGGGLDEPGRMRLRAGNTDRLKRVFLIDRIGEMPALRRGPVDRFIGELFARRIGNGRCGAAPTEVAVRG